MIKSKATLCSILFFAASTAIFGQAGSCSGITPGLNAFTGGSFNGFVPWASNSGWNEDISASAVDSRSATWIDSLRNTVDRRFRRTYSVPQTDSGAFAWDGVPVHVVGQNQPRVEIRFPPGSYPDDSDPGPYPVPFYPRVQGAFGPGDQFDYTVAGDKHVLVIDKDACLLYEMWNVNYQQGKMLVGTASVYDMLGGDHQRPYFKTGGGSVSGMPTFAGTIRYDEIVAGEIRHPIAFTALQGHASVSFTGMGSHHQYRGGDYDPAAPPFGVKVRLRSDFDISTYAPENQTVLRALKKYGMVMIDGGLAIDMHGATDQRWSADATLEMLTRLFLTNNGDFQVVTTGPVYCDPQYHCPGQPPVGPLPVISSLTANTLAVKSGEPVTLQWVVNGVASRIRFITPDIGPVVTDSVVVRPIRTTTYTLMVQNANGRSTQTVTVVVTPSGNPLSPLYIGAKLAPGASSLRVNVTGPDGYAASNLCTASPCPVGVDVSVAGYTMQIQHLSALGQVVASSDVIPVTVK